jgi:hypothetical protein
LRITPQGGPSGKDSRHNPRSGAFHQFQTAHPPQSDGSALNGTHLGIGKKIRHILSPLVFDPPNI